MRFNTPCYIIDEQPLLGNMEKIQWPGIHAGIKTVLALKYFSTWSVFALMQDYMDATTSSTLYQARPDYAAFGKKVHTYSVAFSKNEISELKQYANVELQAISYTAGVPPVATALLIAKGAWDVKEMVKVKGLDPDLFRDLLKIMGLPTSIRIEAC